MRDELETTRRAAGLARAGLLEAHHELRALRAVAASAANTQKGCGAAANTIRAPRRASAWTSCYCRPRGLRSAHARGVCLNDRAVPCEAPFYNQAGVYSLLVNSVTSLPC